MTYFDDPRYSEEDNVISGITYCPDCCCWFNDEGEEIGDPLTDNYEAEKCTGCKLLELENNEDIN
jgi:hypothetical protein